MSDFEDKNHTEFIRFEGLGPDEEGATLSRAAFQLYGFALVNSVRDGNPGFVPDYYLDAITAETDLTSAELVMAGLWERSTDGYRILDQKSIDEAVAAAERMRNLPSDN